MGFISNFFHGSSNEPLTTELTVAPLTEIQKRQQLYDTMQVNYDIVDLRGHLLVPNVPSIVSMRVGKMVNNRNRYGAIAKKFANPGFKWWIVALLHEMECSQNFTRNLANGDVLTKRTTHVPVGHPTTGRPPFSFEFAAIDALKYKNVDEVEDWSIGGVLYFLEGYNGYGYSKYKGINSPYIWSGSNHYVSGKYIKDNVYDPKAVSTQIGTALLLQRIQQIGAL